MRSGARASDNVKFKRFDVVGYDADGIVQERRSVLCRTLAMTARDEMIPDHHRVVVYKGLFYTFGDGMGGDPSGKAAPPQPRPGLDLVEVGKTYYPARPRFNQFGEMERRTVIEVRADPGFPVLVYWVGNATFTADTLGVANNSLDAFLSWMAKPEARS